MKVLYYDCFAGISGDMNLGAMVAVGVPSGYLTGELQKLGIDGWSIHFAEAERKGIKGVQANVKLEEHHHDALHAHEHHQHRNLHSIQHIIESSSLSSRVKEMSMAVFRVVAEAEAKVHGKTIDEIHFHEVGAVDSIVDIVGAAVCLDYLKPDRIIASPVEMGGGFVTCAHGTFPVPAPATVEIMKGHPVRYGATRVEMATPTGVAILAALADEFSDKPSFTVTATGYGVGHRDTEIPNVLRVCLGEAAENAGTTEAVMIECNIDDMNPEFYAYVMEQLFAAGADDVFMQNIVMKKTRPAVLLSVLCSPNRQGEMEDVLMTHTSTLGVRSHRVRKNMLERTVNQIDTPWGTIPVKTAFYQGRQLKSKPEFDACAEIARRQGIGIREIYQWFNKNG